VKDAGTYGFLGKRRSQGFVQSVKVLTGTNLDSGKLRVLKKGEVSRLQKIRRQSLKRRTASLNLRAMTVEDDLNTFVLNALNKATTLGATANQIALRIGYNVQSVHHCLEELQRRGKVTKIGRKLWILSQYRDISRDPRFRGPQFYTKLFENEYEVSFE